MSKANNESRCGVRGSRVWAGGSHPGLTGGQGESSVCPSVLLIEHLVSQRSRLGQRPYRSYRPYRSSYWHPECSPPASKKEEGTEDSGPFLF